MRTRRHVCTSSVQMQPWPVKLAIHSTHQERGSVLFLNIFIHVWPSLQMQTLRIRCADCKCKLVQYLNILMGKWDNTVPTAWIWVSVTWGRALKCSECRLAHQEPINVSRAAGANDKIMNHRHLHQSVFLVFLFWWQGYLHRIFSCYLTNLKILYTLL